MNRKNETLMNFLHEFQKKWNYNKQKNGHISKWEFKQNRKRLKSPVPLAQPFAPVDRSFRNTSAQSTVTQTVNQRGGVAWETRGTIPGKLGGDRLQAETRCPGPRGLPPSQPPLRPCPPACQAPHGAQVHEPLSQGAARLAGSA